MTRASALLAVFALACSDRREPVVATPPAPARVPAQPPASVPGVPHGGTIARIAVTEQADAAITADGIGSMRLWPSLDGKREPIPISLSATDDLAISHAGDDLAVGVLDQAGHVRILRLTLDGKIRSRVQLPGDVVYEQIVAIDGGMLVRRADQTIERFDANGVSRGQLTGEAGERIATIAVRRGSAIAQLVTDQPTSRQLRWIALGEELHWGTNVMLPEGVKPGAVALSPNHRRLALLEGGRDAIVVFDLDPLPKRVLGSTILPASVGSTFGFIDDDNVAAASGMRLQWWVPSPSGDPWAPALEQSQIPFDSGIEAAAMVDGVVVSGFAGSLALSTPKRTQYLGWQDLAIGVLSVLPSGTVVATNASRMLWLDSRLAMKRAIDMRKVVAAQASPYGVVVSDHQVVVQHTDSAGWSIDLYDLDHMDKPLPLRKTSDFDQLNWEPASRTLYLGMDRTIARMQLDIDAGTIKPLPPFASSVVSSLIYVLDPALADGAAAVVVGWSDDAAETQRMLTFPAAAADVKQVRPTSSTRLDGTLLAVAANGTLFIQVGDKLVVRRKGKQVASVKLTAKGAFAPTADGTRLAYASEGGVRLVDLQGNVQWETPLWGTKQLQWSPDGKQLVARTFNGFVTLDGATGKRLAMACAWNFGLHDEAPSNAVFNHRPICEDS